MEIEIKSVILKPIQCDSVEGYREFTKLAMLFFQLSLFNKLPLFTWLVQTLLINNKIALE